MPLSDIGLTDFLLIRHGETAWNRELRFQGQLDVPLNEMGFEQAQRLKTRMVQALAEWQSQGRVPTRLISSDLLRAQQTAQPVAEVLGHTCILNAGLREQCYGVFEGMRSPDIQAQHPDAWQRWLAFDADEAVEGVRAVLRILIVFALVTPFWSLFDQKASTWVIQGKAMVIPHDLWWWPSWLVKDATQMQALNPLMVMLLIPFNNLVLYPALRRMGFNVTALRRMGWGIAISALSWIVAGMLQLQMDDGEQVSLAWQTLPYLLLTFGEVLVSATALEFAYSQAPMAMKGVIMAFWYLTSTFGGLWVLLTNASVRDPAVIGWIQAQGWTENAFLMFFFAGFAFIAALAFGWYARRYRMVDNYRTA